MRVGATANVYVEFRQRTGIEHKTKFSSRFCIPVGVYFQKRIVRILNFELIQNDERNNRRRRDLQM